MRFNAVADYALGKTLLVAYTLSRCPPTSTKDASITESEVALYAASVVKGIAAS